MGGEFNPLQALRDAAGGFLNAVRPSVKLMGDAGLSVLGVAKSLTAALSQAAPLFKPLDESLGRVQPAARDIKDRVDQFVADPQAFLDENIFPVLGIEVPHNV